MSHSDHAPDLDPEVYEAVFYSIENPALVIDFDFRIRDANEAAADFLRYADREALIGTPVTEILVDDGILEDVAERVLHDERWVGECELLTDDNRVFYGMGSAVPIEIDGQVAVLAGVFTDLTERRRHTRALRILNRVLRHNIRNDINVVLGHVEQLGAAVDDDAAEASVEKVRTRLGSIIDSADTARELEHLLNTQERAVVNTLALDEVLREAADRADAAFDARFEYPDTFEPARVVANDTVDRVFREVFENAVEHNTSPEPVVEVSLDVREETAVVSVADNGPGVFESRREMIFGREEIDQVHHGNGFSLFFVDQVMKTYGGDVWVESNQPRGAVFKLQFTRAW
jgi:PAS domain S-box-containing protein